MAENFIQWRQWPWAALRTLRWSENTQSLASSNTCIFYMTAVLVKNSLFILFGVNSQGATTSDFGVINTSNLSWVEQYGGLMSDDIDNSSGGESLSGGTIAGIVVGCIAGVRLCLRTIRRQLTISFDKLGRDCLWTVRILFHPAQA